MRNAMGEVTPLGLVQSLPQPVLAFFRTGTRSAALYQKGKQLA